jgi:amino acid permease
MRGRVYAARGIVIGVAGALSVLGAGVLAQHVGVGFGFLCLAVILILTGFLTTWSLRADAQSETVVAAIGTAAKS